MLLKKWQAGLLALACGTGLAHAEEIKIGYVTGLTGPIAITANEGLTMARGYIEQVNAQGGINGNKITLVAKDDHYDATKTAGLIDEAITKDGVVAFVNTAGTANTLSIIKSGTLNKYKVPLLGVFSGSEAIRGTGSEQIFHTRPSYNDEVFKIARIVSTLGLKKVAVFYQDDGFGASINDSIARASQEHKFDVILKTSYKSGETNFTKQAKEIIAAQPQAIFLMGVPEAVMHFMKAYDAPTGASQIYTLSFVPPKLLIDFAGESRVRGLAITQVVPNPIGGSLQLTKDYQALLASPYGKGTVASPLNFENYMNMRLMMEALKTAGAKPTPEKITQALKGMRNYRIGGFAIDFGDTNRRGSSFLDIAVISMNGRLAY
ncbi:ABC transporter substrate-binding protein [Undibacterium sp. CY18W]|uniref:ABC transporter substrate-binding protein n=1 Tax=Undibacterium hunanense TaxID=2762292 RepID=A0ABR6ZWX7_9BURK|nr:ABC transporter substrate-binding protein [Undibacterium hunanense]MBC3920366.1 ABC transporter substrate-binding protein [Undibacterium hunanense]